MGAESRRGLWKKAAILTASAASVTAGIKLNDYGTDLDDKAFGMVDMEAKAKGVSLVVSDSNLALQEIQKKYGVSDRAGDGLAPGGPGFTAELFGVALAVIPPVALAFLWGVPALISGSRTRTAEQTKSPLAQATQ